MKTPFRLDDHPRRPHPLASPPDGYFEQLPRRVMEHVQTPTARPALTGWLTALSAPLRTALASLVLLMGFVAAFWLTQRPVAGPSTPLATSFAAPEPTIAAVPRAEAVQYLLSDAAPNLNLLDLSDTPVADQDLTASFLPGSDAEVQAVLDEQPAVDTYL